MKRTIIFLTVGAVVSMALAGSMELTSARLYKKQKEWFKAIQFYNEAIQKDPASLEAYFERGELLGGIASDSSLKDVAAEIANDKGSPQRDLYQRMIADFKEAQIARVPSDEKLIKKLKKQIDEIVTERWYSFYASAVHYDSLYMEASAQGSQEPDSKTHLENALSSLDLAIMISPERWAAYGLKAQLLGKLGHRAEATAAWEDAQKRIEDSEVKMKEPESYQKALRIIHANLLSNYYEMGRLPEAIRLADGILAVDAGDPDAIQYKAFSLAKLASDTALSEEQRKANKAAAVEALNNARRASPEDPVILYYMGQFNLQLGDTAAAIKSFQEYLTIDSTDRDVLFALGVLYLEGGSFTDTKKARDTYAKLTEMHDEDAAAWINYGVALIRLGENEAGKKAVERGKSLQSKP